MTLIKYFSDTQQQALRHINNFHTPINQALYENIIQFSFLDKTQQLAAESLLGLTKFKSVRSSAIETSGVTIYVVSGMGEQLAA